MFLLLLFPLVVSCAPRSVKLEVGTYFLSSHKMSGVFEDESGRIPIEITLENDLSLTVLPKELKEYKVTFSESGSKASWDTVEVEGDLSLSRFFPLWEMFRDMRGADFSLKDAELKNGSYIISENGTTLTFSKKTLLPEKLMRGKTTFIFKDLT